MFVVIWLFVNIFNQLCVIYNVDNRCRLNHVQLPLHFCLNSEAPVHLWQKIPRDHAKTQPLYALGYLNRHEKKYRCQIKRELTLSLSLIEKELSPQTQIKLQQQKITESMAARLLPIFFV